MQLLVEHRDVLDKIATTLIEKEKIDGNEMLTLIKAMKPELISDAAIAKVKEMVKPVADAVSDAVSDALSDNGDGPIPASG